MRAFVVDGYGRDVHAAEVAEPTVGPTDVLVAVHAAGVNALDNKIVAGDFKAFLPQSFPLVLGHDLAGVVVEVGGAVTRFAVGDEVWGRPRDGRTGTFAQRIAVDQDDLAGKPESLSMVEAASLPLVALTAWQALVETGGLRAGGSVLVQAGSGGVGTVAVQLAHHLGATVTTTASARNAELLRGLGADTVVDYRTQDVTAVVADQDLVLDSQGGDGVAASLAVLAPGGLVVGIAGPPDAAFARRQGLNVVLRTVMGLLSLRVRRRARRLGVRYSFLFMRASGAQLETLGHLVDAGALRPVVDSTLGFDEVPAALARVAAGRTVGKVVVQVLA